MTRPADNPAAGFGVAPGLDALQALVTASQIKNFSASEVCRLNPANLRPGEPRTSVPPESLWPGMIPTLRLAEYIRDAWKDDIVMRGGDHTTCGLRVVSGYRPRWYNTRINGAPSSQHMAFKALDLSPVNGELGHFMRVAQFAVSSLRESMRRVGFGRYDTFIHIDTGRTRFTWWDNRSERRKADHASYAIGGAQFKAAFPNGLRRPSTERAIVADDSIEAAADRGASPLGLDDTQPGD